MLDRISRSSQVQLRAYGFQADFRELLNCFALNGILKKRFLFSNKHNALFLSFETKKDVKTSNFLLISNLKPRHVLHNSRLTSIYTQYKMNLWEFIIYISFTIIFYKSDQHHSYITLISALISKLGNEYVFALL